MSSPRATPSHDTFSNAKRRKVRKGTHSCWECKRRKMKCIFDPHIASTSCNGCRQRGSPCISQEFVVDDTHIAHSGNDGASLNTPRPIATPSDDGRRADSSVLTPVSVDSEPSRYFPSRKSSDQSSTVRSNNEASTFQMQHERLSRYLHESLPSREDTERICKASRHSSILAHELLTMPYDTLFRNGLKTPDSLLAIPESHVHPVLIARHMLQLATFLQHLHPDLHKEIKVLSEPPRVIMERLVDIAIHHVTTNDQLLGSIESLECIMMESLYQANIGNLRRSWVAGRRAMSIAQLMGLHRSNSQSQYKVLDPKTEHYPQLMWLRIVTLDRHLCLLLGIPQGCTDRNMASETCLANDTPMGRLERRHCALMSRILERNECSPSAQHLAITREIDLELQKAARGLASKWWLPPKFNTVSADLQTHFWDMRRLLAQIFHYNLLIQLHLTYMLRVSSAESKHDYSRMTCVNASREVLSRYITLRNFNRIAYSCRTVDFIALMAAMALLLAHLDCHRAGADNPLAHQYLSDRAMIEQVQENMHEVNKLNSDALSAQSADLLRKLLAIEIEAGDTRVSVSGAGNEVVQQDGSTREEDGVVSVQIPYFGIIRIGRDTLTESQAAATATMHGTAPLQLDRFLATNTNTNSDPIHIDSRVRLPSSTHLSSISHPDTPSPALSLNNISSQTTPTATLPDSSAAFTRQQHQQQQQEHQQYGGNLANLSETYFSSSLAAPWQGDFPELAAGSEDWAFQGVDMAFFESIMRSDTDLGQ
ncbi:C6 zinc finger domain containing protein [Pyrenophora tritici-repentis Pt-1C-BFP]|uniref:Zn2-C6 fungal-type DNA-binding domain containing protein n=3 Tax=Pyrenophora tritici-repentis TaxID=45151 RepID=A0A922N3Q4_9PLEO|nr:C6 zinc finger domain containing protein [Pyrenophora tritici-repentis Pt-1C-BFP]EDU47224.1 C6 zinc finger domain containing protein [Pyrenophora tritici-repentis Pt-1C-BFP]KAI1510709.1 Zn2-C6 fungal-type DNA-binding domain containing protein [Pyrenophora tritici-repentis]